MLRLGRWSRVGMSLRRRGRCSIGGEEREDVEVQGAERVLLLSVQHPVPCYLTCETSRLRQDGNRDLVPSLASAFGRRLFRMVSAEANFKRKQSARLQVMYLGMLADKRDRTMVRNKRGYGEQSSDRIALGASPTRSVVAL